MEISKEELQKYAHDPIYAQKRMYEFIEQATDSELGVSNPNNAFTLLLEAMATYRANIKEEGEGILRRKFASLANKEEDLYAHISDASIANVYSTPAVTPFVISISVDDLLSNGYRDNINNYTETTLPIGSTITVSGITHTVLNDIVIRLYDTNTVFIEQYNNDNDISFKNVGIITGGLISDIDGNRWVVFEVPLKQVTMSTISKNIVISEGFNKKIELTDKYYATKVSYRSINTNNELVELYKVFNDSYVNPLKPTAVVNIYDDFVAYNIPDVFLLEGIVTGEAVIDLYQTKGSIYSPIHKYDSDIFEVNVPNTGVNKSKASIANMSIISRSRYPIDGGSDKLPFTELRDRIVHNAIGNINIPVTDKHLEAVVSDAGFNIHKAIDVLTNRVYVVNKLFTELESNNITVKPDVYNITTNLILSRIDNSKITITNDYYIIHAGAIFKSDNGLVTPISTVEENTLNTLNNLQIVSELNRYKYLYSPYHYINEVKSDIADSRVYDLNNPVIESNIIVAKNIATVVNVNIKSYEIFKTDNGYTIHLTLIFNDEFKQTDLATTRAELVLPLIGGDTDVRFSAAYQVTDNLFTFEIDSDFYIDENNYFNITNGLSTIITKKTLLQNTATVYIYSNDPAVTDSTDFLKSEIKTSAIPHVTVFDKEELNISFGKKLPTLWTKVHSVYTERKYKKYTTSAIATYTEDVYEVYPETGKIFKVITNVDGSTTIVKNILHHVGDTVLDANNDPVYKYKAGDIMLDTDGLPIIDYMDGVIKYNDLHLMDYEYIRSNNNTYRNYITAATDMLTKWLSDDLPRLNENMLENTKLFFKSFNDVTNIKIFTDGNVISASSRITPDINIYTTTPIDNTDDVAAIKNSIGTIIYKTLKDTTINITTLKEHIMAAMPASVVSVKINTMLAGVEHGEVIQIVDETKRFILDKELAISNNNTLVITNKIKIDIINI